SPRRSGARPGRWSGSCTSSAGASVPRAAWRTTAGAAVGGIASRASPPSRISRFEEPSRALKAIRRNGRRSFPCMIAVFSCQTTTGPQLELVGPQLKLVGQGEHEGPQLELVGPQVTAVVSSGTTGVESTGSVVTLPSG